jgi:hypothetical protein
VGLVLTVISAVSFAVSAVSIGQYAGPSVIGLILPVLYLIGAILNKQDIKNGFGSGGSLPE